VAAATAQQLMISLGGVIQNPGVDYTVSTNTITFTTNPASGLDFFGVLLGDAINTGTPSDGTVTTAKLASDLSVDLASGSAGTPSLTFDANSGLFSPANDEISISTNGGERFRVGSAGQFGIGGATYGTSGQVLTSQGSGSAPQWATVSAGYTSLGTTNTTSGSSHTVTGIPTTARHIVIAFSSISVNSTTTPHLTLQVGNGSLSSSDYYYSIAYGTTNQAQNAVSNARIFHTDFSSASNSYVGVINIYTTDNNVIGNIQATALSQTPSIGTFYWAGGSAIDRVNLSTASTFDAGRFIVFYI